MDNYRDAALLGPCDDAVRLLCRHLGWADDLQVLEDNWTSESFLASPAASEPVLASAAAAAAAECEGGEEGARALAYNWRRKAVPIPALRPFDEAASDSGCATALPRALCTLLKPASLEGLLGGRPAHFRVELRTSPDDDVVGPPRLGGAYSSFSASSSMVGGRDASFDYLALYCAGAGDTAERTDRDFPFRDPSDSDDEAPNAEARECKATGNVSAAALAVSEGACAELSQYPPQRPQFPSSQYVTMRPLRLRLPWVRLPLPYDFEVWYVDGATDEVLGRWGPLTLGANAPEDAREVNFSNQIYSCISD